MKRVYKDSSFQEQAEVLLFNMKERHHDNLVKINGLKLSILLLETENEDLSNDIKIYEILTNKENDDVGN